MGQKQVRHGITGVARVGPIMEFVDLRHQYQNEARLVKCMGGMGGDLVIAKNRIIKIYNLDRNHGLLDTGKT